MVRTIIGTGGPITENTHPERILAEALKDQRDSKLNILLPEKTKFMVDKDYVFYAAGLLKTVDEDSAMMIMLNSLCDVTVK